MNLFEMVQKARERASRGISFVDVSVGDFKNMYHSGNTAEHQLNCFNKVDKMYHHWLWFFDDEKKYCLTTKSPFTLSE